MKIAISGISGGFGKYASEIWSDKHEVVRVNLRDSLDTIVNTISECSIFFNHAYSNDTKQSEVFARIFELWKDEPKTIVNFGTSAVNEGGEFSPMYVTNKKHLITLTQTLNNSNPYKKVRTINLNPGTLENNKIYKGKFNTIKFKDLFEVLDFILKLDISIEISDLTIRPTTRQIKSNI